MWNQEEETRYLISRYSSCSHTYVTSRTRYKWNQEEETRYLISRYSTAPAPSPTLQAANTRYKRDQEKAAKYLISREISSLFPKTSRKFYYHEFHLCSQVQ
jgi:hypothetical protein